MPFSLFRLLALPASALALLVLGACSDSSGIAESSAAAAEAPAQNWPQWRGPDGQGHADAREVPLEWSEESGVKWKTATPGRGWSSPVIWGGQVWITTAVETPAKPEDAERRLKVNTGDQPLTLLESVSLRAVCLDRETGAIRRDVEILNVREPQWVHEMNSYASPSPVVEPGRLYASFGALGAGCVDTETGSVLWTNDELRIMHENGPGSTPVLHGDHIILHCDGSDRQFIAALDKHTGKVAWQTDRSGEMHENPQQRKAYGTPLVVDMNGRPTVVSTAADWVYGYDPADGRELWKVPYGQLGFSMSVRPIAGHGMVFFSTCFSRPEVFALRYAGLKTPEVAWHDSKNGPNMASLVLVNDLLFFVSDGGIVSCLDAKTGEPHYRERISGASETTGRPKIKFNSGFSASPIAASGRIYFCSREGVTTVIEASESFKILAQNPLDGKIMASPAAIDGALFIRTDKALYRIGK